MAKKKVFNVQGLYPDDYCFDYETFEQDPEGYRFTKDDIAYFNAKELEYYESEVPMTPYGRRLLRNWVASGHSPKENPGSRYLCLNDSGPYDFLYVHRLDCQLRKEMKGMNKEEQGAYLKAYMGWKDTDNH